MKYFVHNNERVSTVYYEFFKGEWDWDKGDRYHNDGSIFLHDDIMYTCGLEEILKNVLPDYDDCGDNLIYPEKWEEVCRLAEKKGGIVKEITDEAALWVEDAFENCGCFTILGL